MILSKALGYQEIRTCIISILTFKIILTRAKVCVSAFSTLSKNLKIEGRAIHENKHCRKRMWTNAIYFIQLHCLSFFSCLQESSCFCKLRSKSSANVGFQVIVHICGLCVGIFHECQECSTLCDIYFRRELYAQTQMVYLHMINFPFICSTKCDFSVMLFLLGVLAGCTAGFSCLLRQGVKVWDLLVLPKLCRWKHRGVDVLFQWPHHSMFPTSMGLCFAFPGSEEVSLSCRNCMECCHSTLFMTKSDSQGQTYC